ncbi:MAG: exosortase family protein XrtM [Gammaproteobacteria bacterium]
MATARSPLTFALRLLLTYALFHGAYLLIPDRILHDVLYPTLFGVPTTEIVGRLAPGEAVSAQANRIASPRAVLEIVRGCDGSGALFLLAAAILSFPASARARTAGLLLGTVFLYALNLARMIGLYFVAAYRTDWFLPLHTYFIPTLLVVAVTLFYLVWLGRVGAPVAR